MKPMGMIMAELRLAGRPASPGFASGPVVRLVEQKAHRVSSGDPAREADELLDFGWQSVYYNPYACEHWQLENEPFDQYVDRSTWVDVHADKLGANVLAYDIVYKDLCPA